MYFKLSKKTPCPVKLSQVNIKKTIFSVLKWRLTAHISTKPALKKHLTDLLRMKKQVII